MRDVLADAELIAATDSRVLITGESGVGKELLTRFIHANSQRRRQPLLTLNCAGVPETLLETELFGHTRGSFTGAHQNRRGLLETAHLGTIMLDEVGEMAMRMQGILLRFLENGEIQRIGSDHAQTVVDVRVIAATNRVLIDAVRRKEFREDLFYRLNIVHLIIPPLRERREDIRAIFDHYLNELSRTLRAAIPEITPEAMEIIENYDWPGNVRQLRNLVERLLVTRGGGRVTPDDLLTLPQTSPQAPATPAVPASPVQSIAEAAYARMVGGGESFWTTVYEPFMLRDLTREVVREVVRMGLRHTKGNYRLVAQLFNLAPDEYKRFLGFLQNYDCHMPFKTFRVATAEIRPKPAERGRPALTA